MSIIKKISLTQFKNYDFSTFDLSAPVVYISGLNGVGKTNLLDAIYYLCYTKSYFTGYQQNLVQHGQDGFRIEGAFENEGRSEVIGCKWKAGKKEIFVDGVLCEKVTDHIGKYAAVMIAPDDTELINEGSEFRRKWIDGILAQTDKRYFDSLIQYHQVLSQRNAWLKMNAVSPTIDYTVIDFYDKVLTEHGSYIYQTRQRFVADFIPSLNEFYHQLSGGREEISVHYRSDLQERAFARLLKDGLSNDVRMQRTLKGIHKDELEFNFDGKLIRQFGSQGQKKTYLLALKLGQFGYIKRIMGKTPVLLLDDIFEKLDGKRLESLWTILQSADYGQVIITDTEAKRFESVFRDRKDVISILL